MRSCDKRLEMRLPEKEKKSTEAMAQDKGITVSELIRRSLRAYVGMSEQLAVEERICVAALRRRVNQLEARLDQGQSTGIAADLRQARNDVRALLGR